MTGEILLKFVLGLGLRRMLALVCQMIDQRGGHVEESGLSARFRAFVKRNPFRYFKTSPEIIRLAVMMYVRFPLSLRNVEICSTNAASISLMKQLDFGEPLRTTLRDVDPKTPRPEHELLELDLASRRGFRA